jgi:hypothetical protein
MTQVYFHCTSTDRVLLNYGDAEAAGLTEARERAAMMVRALIAAPGPEDWRDLMLHISDDLGEGLFSLPFKGLVGPLH